MQEGELVEKAKWIIERGEQAGLRLRLVGGLAVRLSSPNATQKPILKRSYADLDFVGLGREGRRIKQLFVELGYQPDQRFNALHGQTRLLFYDPGNEYHVDVFLDRFKMCHTLDLRQRLFEGYLTLSLADLLVTKLQVIELNEKDMQDILAIILDHEVGNTERPDQIDASYLGELTGDDWGLYTTLSDNLQRTREFAPSILTEADSMIVLQRIDHLLKALQDAPKTLRWRLREKLGRRIEWYDLPDEVNR
jgi:hypothetical protein